MDIPAVIIRVSVMNILASRAYASGAGRGRNNQGGKSNRFLFAGLYQQWLQRMWVCHHDIQPVHCHLQHLFSLGQDYNKALHVIFGTSEESFVGFVCVANSLQIIVCTSIFGYGHYWRKEICICADWECVWIKQWTSSLAVGSCLWCLCSSVPEGMVTWLHRGSWVSPRWMCPPPWLLWVRSYF